MNFTTKEFCKTCNVGRETLRHYEKMGLLHPKINPDNHYRNYDEWDGSIIADIKKYQALGFSLEEIKRILLEYNLSQLTESVESSICYFNDRANYYQMICKKSETQLRLLQQIPFLQNQFKSSRIPDLIYISEEVLLQALSSDRINDEMNYSDFFTPCMRVDPSYSGNEDYQNYSGWGLIIQKEYADYLGIHDGISIPASETICTVIDAGEKGTLSKKIFAPFFSYLTQNMPFGDYTIYAYLLARTHDSRQNYHRYLYTFYPV